MKSRHGEVLAAVTLAGSLSLSGCDATLSAVPQRASDQYSSPHTVGGRYQSADDDGNWRATVDVYRLKTDSEEANIITDDEIRRQFGLAARYLAFETAGHFAMELGSVEDLVLKPTGIDPESQKSCYDLSDGRRASRELQGARLDDGRLIHLIANSAMLCPIEGGDGRKKAVAYAYDNFSLFNLSSDPPDEPPVAHYIGEYILHETGHNVGLGHFRKFNCTNRAVSVDRATIDMLKDIAGVVGDRNCSVVLDGQGNIDDYASGASVMGKRGVDSNMLKQATDGAFSTLDLTQLMPQVFRLTPITTEPAQYVLEYGEDHQNGLVIELPADHPLKRIDAGLSRLVVTVENSHIQNSEEPFSAPRSCHGRTTCQVMLSATDDSGRLRYELDRTPNYTLPPLWENQPPGSRRVIYIDKQMNFGMIAREDFGLSPTVTVVDYQTAVEEAAIQRQAHIHRQRVRDDAQSGA